MTGFWHAPATHRLTPDAARKTENPQGASRPYSFCQSINVIALCKVAPSSPESRSSPLHPRRLQHGLFRDRHRLGLHQFAPAYLGHDIDQLTRCDGIDAMNSGSCVGSAPVYLSKRKSGIRIVPLTPYFSPASGLWMAFRYQTALIPLPRSAGRSGRSVDK